MKKKLFYIKIKLFKKIISKILKLNKINNKVRMKNNKNIKAN